MCYVVFTCLWSLIWVQGARNYQFSSIFLAGKNIFILTYWPMGLYSNIKPIFDVKPMGFYAREYGTLRIVCNIELILHVIDVRTLAKSVHKCMCVLAWFKQIFTVVDIYK